MEVWNIIRDTSVAWLQEALRLTPNVIAAFFIILAFWLISLFVPKIIDRVSVRLFKRKQLRSLFNKMIKFLIISIGFVVALNVLQLDKAVTSFLAGLGIAGLAIGFAFQEIISNFFAGVVIVVNTPFKIGDIIRTSDVHGFVRGVKLRSTRIQTFDGRDVLVPNKNVLQNILINETKNGERRIGISVGVDYMSDLRAVQSIAQKAVTHLHNKEDREIEILFSAFGDSAIQLNIFYWIDLSKDLDYLTAISEGVIAIQEAFNKNNINMPFPVRTLQGTVEIKK